MTDKICPICCLPYLERFERGTLFHSSGLAFTKEVDYFHSEVVIRGNEALSTGSTRIVCTAQEPLPELEQRKRRLERRCELVDDLNEAARKLSWFDSLVSSSGELRRKS